MVSALPGTLLKAGRLLSRAPCIALAGPVRVGLRINLKSRPSGPSQTHQHLFDPPARIRAGLFAGLFAMSDPYSAGKTATGPIISI